MTLRERVRRDIGDHENRIVLLLQFDGEKNGRRRVLVTPACRTSMSLTGGVQSPVNFCAVTGFITA